MKKYLSIVLGLAFVTFSCCKKISKEEDVDKGLYQNTPNSRVPDELAISSWFYGTISAISYWDRNGHKLGNDYEAGREFQFYNDNGKGRMKFWQYLGMRTSSSCVTEIYTRKEGSVTFEGDKFTFYPVKGSFKTIKDKCSSGNGSSERKAVGEDLLPVTYRWEIRNINGKSLLYTFEKDDVKHEEPIFVYTFAQ